VTTRRAAARPLLALGLLVALWLALGLWICFAAPFASGTDESIRYVAFAAATNRWASEQDAEVRDRPLLLPAAVLPDVRAVLWRRALVHHKVPAGARGL
jgi:hypothetical protein